MKSIGHFRIWFTLLALACQFITVGCSSDPTLGYASTSLYPTAIRSVAVPIFTSKAYTRDVEFGLTDALIKEIQARTPYKVTSEAEADTVLLGTIRDIKLDQLSKSRQTGLSEEMIVSVTIDFQWKDLRTNKTLLEREKFTGYSLFVPSQPSSEPIELGQFAVVQQMARDIVSQMRSEW